MRELLLVCSGGALGSGARYLVGLALARLAPGGTLAVNLLGSFAMGLLIYLGLEARAVTPLVRLTLATGVLGGFTTYSSFNQELLLMLRAGSWAAAAGYLAGTVLGCLAAGALGWWLGSLIAPPASLAQ